MNEWLRAGNRCHHIRFGNCLEWVWKCVQVRKTCSDVIFVWGNECFRGIQSRAPLFNSKDFSRIDHMLFVGGFLVVNYQFSWYGMFYPPTAIFTPTKSLSVQTILSFNCIWLHVALPHYLHRKLNCIHYREWPIAQGNNGELVR